MNSGSPVYRLKYVNELTVFPPSALNPLLALEFIRRALRYAPTSKRRIQDLGILGKQAASEKILNEDLARFNVPRVVLVMADLAECL